MTTAYFANHLNFDNSFLNYFNENLENHLMYREFFINNGNNTFDNTFNNASDNCNKKIISFIEEQIKNKILQKHKLIQNISIEINFNNIINVLTYSFTKFIKEEKLQHYLNLAENYKINSIEQIYNYYRKTMFDIILFGKYKYNEQDFLTISDIIKQNIINFSDKKLFSVIHLSIYIKNISNDNTYLLNFSNILQNYFDNHEIIHKIINIMIYQYINQSNDIDENIISLKYLKSGGYLIFETYFNYLKTLIATLIKQNNCNETTQILTRHSDFIKQLINNRKNDNEIKISQLNEILLTIKNYINDALVNNEINENYLKVKMKNNPQKIGSNISHNQQQSNYVHEIYSFNYDIGNSYAFGDIKDNLPYTTLFNYFHSDKFINREINYDIVNSTINIKLKNYHNTIFVVNIIQFKILAIIIDKHTLKEATKNVMNNLFNKFSRNIVNDAIKSLVNSNIIEYCNFEKEGDNITIYKLCKDSNDNLMENGIELKQLNESEPKVIELYKKMKKFARYPENHSFAFERQQIILCNIIQFAKNVKKFTIQDLFYYCCDNIPFIIDWETLIIILENESDYIEQNGDVYNYLE